MTASADIRIAGPSGIVIPAAALEWQFVRSSGPGGQHVNRTSSKAVLRFVIRGSPHLPDDVRRRLIAAVAPRLTKDGAILIASQVHRDRGRNVAECRARLAALVARAAVPPTVRRRTKVPRSAVATRLDTKRLRSRTKRLRRPPAD
ncbi:MAG: alternative ribosome rescue aminoacyl-tRNA hydrolase ArfB [Planctomycetaceae bacterium]